MSANEDLIDQLLAANAELEAKLQRARGRREKEKEKKEEDENVIELLSDDDLTRRRAEASQLLERIDRELRRREARLCTICDEEFSKICCCMHYWNCRCIARICQACANKVATCPYCRA